MFYYTLFEYIKSSNKKDCDMFKIYLACLVIIYIRCINSSFWYVSIPILFFRLDNPILYV